MLLLRPRYVRVPPVAWPVFALIVWTLLSIALSDDPAAALPQIKKLFVFATLPLVYTGFRAPDACQRAVQAWFVVALGSCGAALAQFALAVGSAWTGGGDFQGLFAGARITGFYSHWMTFSEVATLVLATLSCYALFARRRRGAGVWVGVAVTIAAALVLSFTRSAWLALVVCALYFLAIRSPRLLAAVPVVLAVAYLAAPEQLRQRVDSMQPEANRSRIIMWRTGLKMIAEHPLAGVGPERVGPLFARFQPEDVDRLPSGFYGHLHNVFVHFAAERGIPAALILLWLFAQVLIDMRSGLSRLRAGRDDCRFLLHAGVVSTLAIAVLSCFDVALGDSEVLAAYMAIVAVAYRGLPTPRNSS